MLLEAYVITFAVFAASAVAVHYSGLTKPSLSREAGALRKLGIALVLALLLILVPMVAGVFLDRPGSSPPTVLTQRDCPERNGETHYLYVDGEGRIVRCLD